MAELRAGGRRDPVIRSQLVGPMLVHVAQRGGDVAALVREFDLPATASTDAEVMLPLARLQAFFAAAEVAADDPHLGLHVARVAPSGRWSAIEYGARSAATLREALGRLARYAALFNEHVVVTFVEKDGVGTLAQRIPGRPLCLGRHGNEFFAMVVLAQLRAALAGPLVPLRVFFAHPRPRDVTEHVHALGTDRIEFEAEANGFAVAGADLEMPLASRDAALGALVDAYVERELERRGTPEPGRGLLAQVRRHVRQALDGGAPELAEVARACRMSPRSLQRQLAEHGTSFAAVLQSAREELARVWVEAGDRPLGDIAYSLGYAELGPFLRAFRRWTGMTPAAYRARAITGGTRT